MLYKEWCAKRTSIDMPSFEPYFHENSSKLSSHVRKRLRRQMFAQQIYKTTHWSYVKKQIKKEKLWSYLQTRFWCFVKPWSKVILGEISKTLNFLSESYFIFMQHQHESFAFWYSWRESPRSLNSSQIINAVTWCYFKVILVPQKIAELSLPLKWSFVKVDKHQRNEKKQTFHSLACKRKRLF